MGISKNLCVFNFAILLKSRKFDAREICMYYSNVFKVQQLKLNSSYLDFEPIPMGYPGPGMM